MAMKIPLNDTSTLDGGGQEESLRDAVSVSRCGMDPACPPDDKPVTTAEMDGSSFINLSFFQLL
jgi:hypothetical protein